MYSLNPERSNRDDISVFLSLRKGVSQVCFNCFSRRWSLKNLFSNNQNKEMGLFSSRAAPPLVGWKKVQCDDGKYRWKKLIRRPYAGHPGYTGLVLPLPCDYCQELHTCVGCPYKWYYEEVSESHQNKIPKKVKEIIII